MLTDKIFSLLVYLESKFSFPFLLKNDLEESILRPGSVALVTGGSSGLGLEIVKQLLSKRCTVIILDIYPPNIQFGADKALTYYKCDVGSQEEIEKTYKRISKDHASIHILINNAGITCLKPITEFSKEEVNKVINVNYLGACKLMHLWLSANNEGFIVNIASVLGLITPARLAAYGASKGGLISFHQSLNLLLKKRTTNKIKMLLVCTGKIRTKMFQSVDSPSTLFAPDIKPDILARRIVKSIERGNCQTIRMPFYANLVLVFLSLQRPYISLLKKISKMDEATKI
ncbi:hypothetical protein NCAS_0B06050 [Naumovozyma castellii]|uniref:Uncharacterized protein n=1 Tax=Naumovozyma castellii TaxID=27288 RepID=G0V9S2_NAUCA|nr:hypothetical protein NCAS_0B06050 [Naumovozyma castellii CBS 4309]CCC68689.1 hypothetical protein NCAS_0B06050 [Naumovozyma castellii CBS 4309]